MRWSWSNWKCCNRIIQGFPHRSRRPQWRRGWRRQKEVFQQHEKPDRDGQRSSQQRRKGSESVDKPSDNATSQVQTKFLVNIFFFGSKSFCLQPPRLWFCCWIILLVFKPQQILQMVGQGTRSYNSIRWGFSISGSFLKKNSNGVGIIPPGPWHTRKNLPKIALSPK